MADLGLEVAREQMLAEVHRLEQQAEAAAEPTGRAIWLVKAEAVRHAYDVVFRPDQAFDSGPLGRRDEAQESVADSDPWFSGDLPTQLDSTGKAPQEPGETRLGFELAEKAMRTGHTVKAQLSLHRGTVEGTVISVEDRYCLLDTGGIGCGHPSMRVYWAELDAFEILPGDDEKASQELPSGSKEGERYG
jgi:hypothetical protein